MTKLIALVLIASSLAVGSELPNNPKPVEHDPVSWSITTALTTPFIGAVTTKPVVGLVGGLVWAIIPNAGSAHNLPDKANVIAGVAGAVVGYVAIKALKGDFKRHAKH
jgi:hypothetical protein